MLKRPNDVLSQVPFHWAISSQVPTVNGDGDFVGHPDGDGGIVLPYDYFYINGTDTPPHPGAFFLDIKGNSCTRTLEPTTNYSDYGFGERLMITGYVDPEITASEIGGTQIEIANHAWYGNVEGNTLWGGTIGVYLNGTASSAYISWKDILIAKNNICNFTDTGVFLEGEGIAEVNGNTIDGDPHCVDAQRGSNGKWSASGPTHYAFRSSGGVRASITRNEVRNVGQFVQSASDLHIYNGNILYCNPNAVGDDADNIGIRNIGNPSAYGSVQIEDGDPASATWGTLLNPCVLAASSMPASGKYVAGHYVINTAATATNGTTILGWKRITTGRNHVLGTDWVEDQVGVFSGPATSLGTLGATESISLVNGEVQYGTLDQNCTITLPALPSSGRSWRLYLVLTQDGTGGWFPSFTSRPTPNTDTGGEFVSGVACRFLGNGSATMR